MNRPPNFTKQLLLFVLLSALVAPTASATRTRTHAASPSTLNQSPMMWVTVAPPGENFSVRMPRQPTRESVEQANMPGLTGTAYSASGGRIYYTVKSIGNVGRGGTPRGRLANFITKFKESFLQAAGAGAQMNYSRDVNLGGFVGQHYRLITPNMRGLARFYATERRIYVLEVSGGDENDTPVAWFLDSFSITEPPPQIADDWRPPPPPPTPGRNNRTDRQGGSGLTLKGILDPPPTLDLDSDLCECGDGNENTKSQMSADGRLTRDAILCSKGELELTEEAVKHGFNGEVRLMVELLKTGEVGSIEVEQGQPYGLTEKAIDFARQYKFCPALLDGEPATQMMPLTCTFTVRTYIRTVPPVRRSQPRRRRP